MRRFTRRSRCALTIAAFASIGFASSDFTSAAIRTWLNPVGGSYETVNNWSGAVLPTVADSALFNLASNGGYTVQFTVPRSVGSLSVANDNTTFNLGGTTYSVTLPVTVAVTVGFSSGDSGRLTIQNGTLSAVGLTEGLSQGSAGSFTIGSGATGSFSSIVSAGNVGNGTISVLNGGSLVAGQLVLGQSAGAAGTALLSGGSFRDTVGNGCQIGFSGSGTISLNGPSTSAITQGVSVGVNPSSAGTVSISNSATWSNSGGSFTVGKGGAGTLLLSFGTLSGGSGTLGGSAGATGYATIGFGAAWTTSFMTVGAAGDGTLIVNDGGTASSGAVMNIADVAGSSGAVLVTGNSASLSAATSMNIGNFGDGTLNILAGAHASAGSTAFVGNAGHGTVTVDGTNSSWNVGSTLLVAPSGSGAVGVLNITNGASVTSGAVSVGGGVGSSGSALVSGAGASWTSNGSFEIGGLSSIAGGNASVTVGPSATLTVAGANVMRIDTPGALHLAGGTLTVGTLQLAGGSFEFASGTLQVSGVNGLTLGAGGPFGSTLNLSAGKSLTTFHDLSLLSGALLVLSGGNCSALNIANGGEILLQDRTSLLSGSFINFNNALLDGDGRISGPLGNSGEVRADSGKRISFSNGFGLNFNQSLISLLGGTLEFDDLLTNRVGGRITGRGTLVGRGGLDNLGSISFSAGVSDVIADLTNETGAKTIITGGSTSTFYNPVNNLTGSEFRVSTASTAVFLDNVTGLSAFTGPGTKDFEANASGREINSGNGTTIVGPDASVSTTFIRDGALLVEGTASVSPNWTAANVSRVGALSIDGGTLDLADNDLIATATATSQVQSFIVSGRHGGAWDSAGLTSSSARAHPSHSTTLGLLGGAEYKRVNGSSFDGFAVADTDVLVKYTWYGDTDFNGKVNFDDYVRIDNGFNNHLTGWLNGDLDLNGVVNFDDYVLIDLAFNTQSGTLGRALSFLNGTDRSGEGMNDPALRTVQEHLRQLGDGYAQHFLAAVPEPVSIAVCAGRDDDRNNNVSSPAAALLECEAMPEPWPGEPARLFLLSPANCGGERARLLLRREASFELAMQVRTPKGASIADVFSFLSGLYFRGKAAYVRAFASPPPGIRDVAPAYVITPNRGLMPLDTHVTLGELHAMAQVPIDLNEPRYVEPMQRDVEALASKLRGQAAACEVVLLGSIATGKYVDLLLPALGERLRFPSEFVGRGDMSRGGLMLRCVDAARPLTYAPLHNAVRKGSRPPKLAKRELPR